eukprot:CAMPEP_0172500224 /NCGR_PEP_ID=MMETSP1066-20121228/135959_1 /TAXON_ID=671091 /ORGANISM="Coscinodiscus wailesii, Strain CCMP2513" /LENGTH=348 /DNA_ID=CAMNT_0013274351 /DNA_START=35 /DNA_END=1081 /DNA_ORIENTATION=+
MKTSVAASLFALVLINPGIDAFVVGPAGRRIVTHSRLMAGGNNMYSDLVTRLEEAGVSMKDAVQARLKLESDTGEAEKLLEESVTQLKDVVDKLEKLSVDITTDSPLRVAMGELETALINMRQAVTMDEMGTDDSGNLLSNAETDLGTAIVDVETAAEPEIESATKDAPSEPVAVASADPEPVDTAEPVSVASIEAVPVDTAESISMASAEKTLVDTDEPAVVASVVPEPVASSDADSFVASSETQADAASKMDAESSVSPDKTEPTTEIASNSDDTLLASSSSTNDVDVGSTVKSSTDVVNDIVEKLSDTIATQAESLADATEKVTDSVITELADAAEKVLDALSSI